ncbi:PREDICTED: gasdermin-B-like [Elephantulus edwardii]|uniref:gasdermin-B-like n=1 Tax=Elephantulus edwardii TaxID=28737 RepID=UPI0003F0B426|nr:PREDICTED: gasdermin-B-like [Elephantulus edwardii]
MSSIFEKVTRTVVHELVSGGDMIAVRSVIDADRFKCHYLVREKKTIFGTQHCMTGLTLEDILEEYDSGSEGQKSEFRILNNVASNGKFTVKLPKEIKIEGQSEVSQGTKEQEIKILGERIPQQDLESLVDRKLKRNLPPSFESIRKKRDNLNLVTETLMTANEETLRREKQFDFWIWLTWFFPGYKYKSQKSVTIPPKWVLGYRIKPLVFSKDEMNISFLDKRHSFPQGKSLENEDTRNMKEIVEDMKSGLRNLTEKEKKDVLSCLTHFLSNDGHLQELQDRVSDAQISGELQMDGPAGPLIRCLFNDAGVWNQGCAEAIQDLLDALMELPEEGQQFVVKFIEEKETLPLLVEKVESTLKENHSEYFDNLQNIDGDTEARVFCALYVVLSGLSQLNEKSTNGS